MGFTTVTTDRGSFYLVAATGELRWYRDLARDGSNAQDGSTGWDPRSGAQIGTGWESFARVFSGGDGVVYAITPTGDLLWYKDTHRDGTIGWAARSGAKIGTGWNVFQQVISGGDGVIYAITPTGDLLWYKDTHRDGTIGWDRRSGTKIGTAWAGFDRVLSGGNGVLYAIRPTGELLWYQDTHRDGTVGWAARSGSTIGTEWDIFAGVVAGGDGILYAITVDGFVLFYRDLAGNGTWQWANDGLGQTIRSGWFLSQPLDAAVQGYPVPLSAEPGQTIDFKVSAATDYTATILRLKPADDGSLGAVVAEPTPQTAQEQDAPLLAWRDGCGWRTGFSVTVGQTWRSGIYAAHCAGADHTDAYLTFVVRPTRTARASFAVLANTNTWNAYNDWGGRSKYSLPPAARLSEQRPNPAASPADDGQLNHLTRAELWVLGWLEEEGQRADVWTDRDFHDGIEGLAEYQALILTTHPEYWSAQAMDNLQAYLDQGGCLLYLGGNGLFERVDVDPATGALILLGGNAASPRPASYFRNLHPPRPEREILGVAYRYDAYSTFAPYRVLMAGHRFFEGTGLANGDLIGAAGRNGAASGWEMDTSLPGRAAAGVVVSAEGADDRGVAPANLQLLARGTNPGYGADITYYETDGGGFVFSTGSISFGGSLAEDPKLQQLIRNVLAECLAREPARP
jgi:hypothetical protein